MLIYSSVHGLYVISQSIRQSVFDTVACISLILKEWREEFRHSCWEKKEQRHCPRNTCDVHFSAQKAVEVEQARRTTERQGGQG